MTSPLDKSDESFDASLSQALKTQLPNRLDNDIRARLDQQTPARPVPAWAGTSAKDDGRAKSGSLFSRRFNLTSMAAAVVLAVLGTLLIFSLLERRAAPSKIVDPVPPPKSRLEPKEFSPDDLWKNGENVATRGIYSNDPLFRAKVDALLLRLRDASKQRDFESVDKIARELQDLLSPKQK